MNLQRSQLNSPELLAAKSTLIELNQVVTTAEILTAVELNISDIIDEGTLSCSQISQKAQANEEGIFRLLRALEGLGYYEQVQPGFFKNTIKGLRLRENDIYSVKGAVQWLKIVAKANLETMTKAVKTGKQLDRSLFDNKTIYEYCGSNPQVGNQIQQYIDYYSIGLSENALQKVKFEQFEVVCDIGGGVGKLLTSILEDNNNIQGILFDLPYVLQEAKVNLEKNPCYTRISFESGDFFVSVPKSQAYIMQFIIHNWDDDNCIKILKNIRQKIPTDGKLFIFEQLVPLDGSNDYSKHMDMVMLTLFDGKERDIQSMTKILELGGFKLEQVIMPDNDLKMDRKPRSINVIESFSSLSIFIATPI